MTERPTRAAAVLAALLLAGCGKEERTYEITDVRERKDAGPAAREIPTAERFRFARDARKALEEPEGELRWAWSTPEGWTETGAGQFRVMGWKVGGEPDVDATFSLAKGDALANYNRWRDQMGLAPAPASDLAALERRPFLGGEAVFVDLTGTFTTGAMSGSPKTLADARMLGLMLEAEGTSAFLKMTGPAAAVDAQRERFLALAASIRPQTGHPPTGGATKPPPGPDVPAASPPPGHPEAKDPFSFTAPAEWVRQPERQMRIATFKPKDAKETEIVVSRFAGTTGGLEENVKRWRAQMGQPPATPAEIEALPRAPALGRTAVFVSIDGAYGGMDGNLGKKGWTLAGALLQGDDYSVFVKMVGPTAEVRAEEARLRAFVESFRE